MRGCFAVLVLSLVLGTACGPKQAPGPPSAQAPRVTDREWRLVALGDRVDPVGAGGRPPTLRLDSASGQASGFGGCNRYAGSYSLAADELRFGPVGATRMACVDGDEVERDFFAMLEGTTAYALEGEELVLSGSGNAPARFRSP